MKGHGMPQLAPFGSPSVHPSSDISPMAALEECTIPYETLAADLWTSAAWNCSQILSWKRKVSLGSTTPYHPMPSLIGHWALSLTLGQLLRMAKWRHGWAAPVPCPTLLPFLQLVVVSLTPGHPIPPQWQHRAGSGAAQHRSSSPKTSGTL